MKRVFKELIVYAFIIFTIILIWNNIEMKEQLSQERSKNIELRSRDEYRYIGYTVRKYKYGTKFYIDIVGYGKYEVSEVEYYEAQIGELCPTHILKRRNSNG